MINRQSPEKNLKKDFFKNDFLINRILLIIEKFLKIHIKNQVDNGANIIQIFDSWAGLLSEKDLPNYVYIPTLNLVDYVKSLKVPVICFPRGVKNYKNYCDIVKPDVVSIYYDVNPISICEKITIPVQGGLDPKTLLTDKENLKKENIELLIVGPMPNAKYLSFLKNLISDHGLEANVKFFGEVDRKEVKSFYSKINLMILPSVSEGLARVIFESQATACPVLVTDAPGMGDIVIDGQTGYVFESNNVESLAKKIQYIEENYDEAMHVGRNAKDFILNNCSAENFKFSFKKIFDTV